MKPHKILLFFILVFCILGIIWYFFPKEDLKVGQFKLRFPSYAKAIERDTITKLNVDSVIESIQKSFVMTCSESQLDSLNYFRDFLTKNPNRIYLPNNDFHYFDTLFQQLELADSSHTIRVMHYGDSQIELDRISAIIRAKLQEFFGGSGVGMLPAIQKIPSVSISQSATGNLTRYVVYGDSTTQRASHKRYGVMGQFSELNGSAKITFRQTTNSQAQECVKNFSHISLLIGNNSEGFSAELKADTFPVQQRICEKQSKVSLLTWEFPKNIKRVTLSLEGKAEIYAILVDGKHGVAVDNNPLRGCSGTIFTKIDPEIMHESFALLNTRLIILQFGGNRMPSITSRKNISPYMQQIKRQIAYFKAVAPQAKLLFIGPSDMGKSVGGKITTWPNLPELNDSLKATTLQQGIAYWDMFNVMGGCNSMVRWVAHQPPYATSDYIHFTHQGANEIGNILSKSLETYYHFYQLRQSMPNDSVIQFIHNNPLQ